MSPPDTNLEKQKRRHWGPLLGIGLAGIVGIGLILFLTAGVVDEGAEPQGADVQIDGRTGDAVVDEPTQDAVLPE